jgi:hypothetical protein
MAPSFYRIYVSDQPIGERTNVAKLAWQGAAVHTVGPPRGGLAVGDDSVTISDNGSRSVTPSP